jgi:dienelactone hydrolase
VKRLAVALAVAVSCLAVPARPAHSAVRYRDEVFGRIKTTKNIPYGNHPRLKLDVHEPAGDTAKLRAAVVWVHGGFFRLGSKEDYSGSWSQFARAGFVTFSINYRLHPEIPHGASEIVTELEVQATVDATEDAQHDAQAAVRWVKRHAKKYRIDPERVAIAGHSAGGITAQRVLFNDHDPGVMGSPGYSSRVAAAVSMAGGSIPVLLARIDPMEPPLLEIHGLADDIVPAPAGPPSCAVSLLMLNTCELVFDPDQDHGTFGHAEARDFLFRHVISKPPGIRPTTKVTITGFP